LDLSQQVETPKNETQANPGGNNPVAPLGGGGDRGTLLAFWDTETNGLLPTLSKVHCLGARFEGAGTKTYLNCADQPGYTPMAEGLAALEKADIRVAHNGVDFDERATRKCFPNWRPHGIARDTLIIARLLFAKPQKTAPNNHKLTPQMRSRHSLEAWGLRLGEHKAHYEPPLDENGEPWQIWEPGMSEYMGQDITSLRRLFIFLMSRKPSNQAIEIEHDFAAIMGRQEAWGFAFNMEKARKLAAKLHHDEQQMEARLVKHFGEWWAPSLTVKVKKTRKVKMLGFPDVTIARFSTKGKPLKPYVGPPFMEYEERAEYTPVERRVFNPKSRDDVKFMLAKLYDWKPTKFNMPTKDKKTGKMKPPTAKIDDEVLRQLPWSEAQILADYYVVLKAIGYLSSGANAWLALARGEPSRIHGRVIHIGTYTHRCSHMKPNMGQVISVVVNEEEKPVYGLDGGYGADCRELFEATPGFVLCGTDAAGIQLRLFGHYLAAYDGGEYARIVDKEDPHAWLRDIVGTDILGPGKIGRGKGKTLGYARLLGGGDLRLGQIAAPDEKAAEQKKVGKLVRERLAERFKAELLLGADVKAKVMERGYVIGLDGRRVDVLKAHTGLATLLQSGEAIVMKLALACLDRELQGLGWRCGVNGAGIIQPIDQVDYEFVANVHDEWEADVRAHLAEQFCKSSNASIVRAGVQLRLRCPLKGDSRIGKNWLEVH
jgi:DNA polymerase-1